MTTVETPSDLLPLVGEELGISSWHEVTESAVLRFAEVTGDRHWIHTDPERARRETPFGGVLAHGFLTLSLLTSMFGECVTVRRASRWTNYGLDRVRFTHPVVPGDRLRTRVRLTGADDLGGDVRLRADCTMEIAGCGRPALVAVFVSVAHA